MPPTRVIGVDAGGTKLLGGVVDGDLVVHHRVHRTWRGADRQETLDIFVEAVEEIRNAAPDVTAVGFGIPALVDRERGVAALVHAPPARGRSLPRHDERAARAARASWTTTPTSPCWPSTARARRGAGGTRRWSLLGTGIGGGLLLDGRIYRGANGFGAELGHIVVDYDGPDCQGACPGRGCLEVLASGSAIGREARRAAHDDPDSALGKRLAAGAEITGAIATELAHDGDAAARAALTEVGRRLGAGLGRAW